MSLSISQLREMYRQRAVRYLLLAESPPLSSDENIRFFYNPDQERHDHMFRAIMEVVFPDFRSSYERGDKHRYLLRLMEAGFYLLDATDGPIDRLSENERRDIIEAESQRTVHEIGWLVSEETPISLMEKNISETFHPRLKKLGLNVAYDEFLPFPSVRIEGYLERLAEARNGLRS